MFEDYVDDDPLRDPFRTSVTGGSFESLLDLIPEELIEED